MPAKQPAAQSTGFETKLFRIGSWTILKLPSEASAKLPSRGQVMVEGSLNGVNFSTPLEPDGNHSHWFRPDAGLLKTAGASAGDTVKVELSATKDWPEPEVPADVRKALDSDTEAYEVWRQATPMAHWEWVRWIRSTGKDETRKKRIKVGMSKLRSGERRPCCWNRNACSEPSVSKSGVLLEPAQEP